MDDLKNIFGDKALTYDDFTAAVSSNENIQLANVAGGAYISRSEYRNNRYRHLTANIN